MKNKLLCISLILLGVVSAFGQQTGSPTTSSLEVKFRKQFESDRKLAEQMARDKNLTLRRTDRNGRVQEFYGFDLRGNMLFNITDNVGAGRTISTNKVWPGGTVGTSLTGIVSGARLGVWDGGAVRTSHQEYVGRVTQVDGATNIIDHATHVSGTMIGTGVNPSAKGMAYQANLKAYDWTNDASEMVSAASTGMLISNHSYGTIAGWYWDGTKDIWYGDPSVSQTEDYKFGFYDQTSANWDDIAYNNPYYLICKSAGNDRGNNKNGSTWYFSDGTQGITTAPPADGQYDCIATYSGAKNVLTVGAVRKIGNSNANNGYNAPSDVVMSSFSSWGPMDDGRIKPDVVGCGVSVFSSVADSDKAYSSYDGTSMATPNVSGSLLLVQQHYNNIKGTYMKAATLKGLAIHTADEAGNAGPDYVYGWGLVNIAKAVQVISDSVTNQIQERSLINTKTYSQSISSAGVSPLKITICWTDPAGTPVSVPTLDPPNKMLVNDLDIRLIRVSDNAIFYPYILNKDSPSVAARTGNNIIDNVEQIYLSAPQAGNYTLMVSHKGNLTATQNYSLLISGLMGIPSAILQSNTRSVCTGSQVTYTDLSSGSPTSRNWYFPGGSPASSTAASTNVTYNTAGKYPVILVVSNALGKDSVYKVNYITAGGITLPFTETFESNSATLSSWTIDNPNNDTTWRLVSIGGTTPGNTAYCMPFFNYSNIGRRDGLITPALSFKGYSSVNLSFTHAYAKDPTTGTDSLVVWVSTNCGNTWTRLLSRGETGSNNFRTVADDPNEFIPDSASKWCSGTNSNCITVNLNAYAGLNNIKIKLEGYNQYSNNLFIDNVTINGTALLPVANFYASKKTACVGESINFYDSTTNIATAWQWTFTGANLSSSSLQNPTGIVFNTPGTYPVKLRSTNSSGSDSITKINYITVVANPGKPSVSHVRPLNFCAGDSVNLVCDSAASGYQWRLNGSKIGGATLNHLTVFNTGTYSVDVSNASGCITPSDTLRVTATPYPTQPNVTSNLSSGFMCTGGTATLTSSAGSGNQWYRDLVSISGAVNNTYNTTDSGIYNVQINNAGCLSPMSADLNISLLPLPVTSAVTGKDSALRTRVESYTVMSNPGSSFNWTIIGGNKTSGGNTNSITIQWTTAGAGSVKVQETGGNGCKGITQTKNVFVIDNVGLNEITPWKNISIFPNPATQFVSLQFESATMNTTRINLLNVLGQNVWTTEMNVTKGKNEKTVSLDSLESGVYFMELVSGTEKYTRQLIIRR